MSDSTLEVLRAEDLLKLRFEFVNLVLDPDESRIPRRLIRASPDEDSFVVVHFQPQHIAERVFSIRPNGTLASLPRPGSAFPARIAGESRLAFRLPPESRFLSLTLDALLDWESLEPVYTIEEEEQAGIVRDITRPLAHHTAIEIPFRITLSPDRSSRWLHRLRPVSRNGTVELWHTRLVARRDPAAPASLWAVWSPDAPNFQVDRIDLATSLNTVNRSEIVRLSSDFKVLDPSNFHDLNEDRLRRLEELRTRRSQELAGEQLILSALGGTLRARSRFFFPPLGDLVQFMGSSDSGLSPPDTSGLFALDDWIHVAVMGRDQYVRVVERGYLFPFGHRADKESVIERRFSPARDTSEPVAYLTRRTSLIVQEPERTYGGSADLPFDRIRITSLVTPPFEEEQESLPQGCFIPTVAGTPYAFPVTATDRQGRPTELHVPMIFVPATQTDNLVAVGERYQSKLSRVPAGNQPVAFAADPSPPTILNSVTVANSATILNTATIHFDHSGSGATPPFRPLMKEAVVRLPGAEQLLGVAREARIAYHQKYLQAGMTGANGVFARIVDRQDVKFPAEQVGGVAAPSFVLDGISAVRGAVPNVDALASNFATPTIELPGGELLGVIDLKHVAAAAASGGELPEFVIRKEGNGHRTIFSWRPSIRNPLPAEITESTPLKTLRRLELTGSFFRPLQPSARPDQDVLSDVTGVLQEFSLVFAGLVKVEFASLMFRMATGRKPEFDPDISNFEFLGELTFLKTLAEKMPGFGGSGPVIKPLPDGVTAGITLMLPAVKLGALGLQNLALSAYLSLYFSKPAELRFALSSRESPFLISYSVFGGGGFFALTVSSSTGKVGLEAAIEFGAVVALDIVIARGEAKAMVGVYFSIREEKALLEGYVRLYACLVILKIITLSVEFYLSLSFDGENAIGRAAVTVTIRVLAFSKSVTLEVTRRISTKGSSPLFRAFSDSVSLEQWIEYCDAFA